METLKRLAISSKPSNSVVTTPWGGLVGPFIQSLRVLRKVARLASIALVIYWLIIFTGTHLPTSAMPNVTLSDKLSHGLAFCGLAFLLAWALPCRDKRLTHVGWAAIIALAYSCIDELTQNFIPGRTCDIWDMAADWVGIVVGLSCYLVLRQVLLQMRWGRNLLQGLTR